MAILSYEMNLFLVMLSIVGGTLAATVPNVEGSTSQVTPTSTNALASSPVASYSSPPNIPQPNTASSQFYYPTYPEYNEPGYSVQTGYEGYLVPATTPEQPSSFWSALAPISRFALSYGARAGYYLMNLLLLIVVGGMFTTSVCTFTPLCTITILGLGRSEVREQVKELARTYMTPEKISLAARVVRNAIDKYTAMQKEPVEDTKDDS